MKVAPHRLQYPDPKAPDARRPKRIEVLPDAKQIIEEAGMYMFTVKTNTFKRALFLSIAVVLGFLVLLWRVWPIWLRVGVWYACYYLAIALVSPLISNRVLDCDSHNPFDSLVRIIPHRH